MMLIVKEKEKVMEGHLPSIGRPGSIPTILDEPLSTDMSDSLCVCGGGHIQGYF